MFVGTRSLLRTNCCYCRFGFLRDYFKRFTENDPFIYLDEDDNWPKGRKDRTHTFQMIEILLVTAGYNCGDLRKAVLSAADCHHKTIPSDLLGFMYFLLFEYFFKGEFYEGATGRHKFKQRRAAIAFFNDVAQAEYEDLFAEETDDVLKMWK